MPGKPCIAIPVPTCYLPQGPIIDRPASYCFREYIDAVRIGGGYPFLLPILDDPEYARDILGYFHGLLLIGGEDVVPARYGATPHPKLQRTDAFRDEPECVYTRLALERDLPVLAICRGIQLLNVATGGTLIQDIGSQVPNSVEHTYAVGEEPHYHEITFTPDSTIGQWYTRPTIKVNSHHHQSIDQLGSGVRVAAVAPDGVIEAVEMPEQDFVVGVQWHPERMIPQAAEQVELFEQFIAASVRRAAVSGHMG
ncbi:MAG: gamma-glutamyl-gamma-aminobutyrate hydrolase family protein [bacterium]